MAVQKQTGIKIAELQYAEATDDFQYILEHYYNIKRAKGDRITFTELAAYSELTCANLGALEVEMLMLIDRIYEASLNG